MSVVVTGSSGFLGHHLVSLLRVNSVEVRGVCRRSSPGMYQVADYSQTPDAEVLIHLAELNDRQLASQYGYAYENAALHILEVLLAKSYRKVIYISSGLLYGDKSLTPRRVSDPLYITDTYTRVKHQSESMVLESGGLVARMANLYGPGMSSNNVFSTILHQLPSLAPITLHDSCPIRDFLWAADAVNAIMAMLNQTGPCVYNIGSGIGNSIQELATLASLYYDGNKRDIISIVPAPSVSSLVLDISDTILSLGWQPSIPLKVGVQLMLKSHFSHLP